MTHQFKSETLRLQADDIIMSAFEGDNEHAIIDASSNGTSAYHVVTVALECDEVCLNEQKFDNMPDAIKALGAWVADEYTGK